MDKILSLYRMDAGDGLLVFWLKELLVAVLIFAAFWVLAQVIRYVLSTWGPRFTSFTKTDLDDRILQRITPPVAFLFVCAGLYFGVRSLPLPEKVHLIASGFLFVVNMVVLTTIAYRIIEELLNSYTAHLAEQEISGVNQQLLPLIEKLISIFLIATVLIITLKHFNYDILSLVAALGIGSLALGLAAKDTLANMISGFTLMIDRPFRIGDRIQLSSSQSGDVVDIGLRSTKIKTLDSTFLIIPNSELCNSTMVNMAFPDLRAKGRINVGVAYGSDVAQVKSLLEKTALEAGEVLHDPPPEAYFVSFGDSTLNMSLFFWVDNYARIFPVTDMINCRILTRFQENSISIPYPIRTVLLEKES